MIVYSVYDGNEFEVTYETKREAIASAREQNKDRTDGFEATVTRIDLGEINKVKVIACINGEGYALSQKVIYPPSAPLHKLACVVTHKSLGTRPTHKEINMSNQEFAEELRKLCGTASKSASKSDEPIIDLAISLLFKIADFVENDYIMMLQHMHGD